MRKKDFIYLILWIMSMGLTYLGAWMFYPAVNEDILDANNLIGIMTRFGLFITFSGVYFFGLLIGHAMKSDDSDKLKEEVEKWKKVAEANAIKQDITAG